jgi:hypothetical protein
MSTNLTQPRERQTAIVEFSDEQTALVLPLINALQAGETVVAQVWPDGMRVARLNKDESDAFSEAIGGYRSEVIFHSVADSEADRLKNASQPN